MSQPPAGPQQQIKSEERPGVDGETLWATGARGRPFSLVTFADFSDLDEAETFSRAYQAFVGSDPVSIIYAGIEQPYQVVALNAVPLELKRILGGLGGLSVTSTAILRAGWTLHPINPNL